MVCFLTADTAHLGSYREWLGTRPGSQLGRAAAHRHGCRLGCRELTPQDGCLRLDDRVLRAKIEGRLRFTGQGTWSLVEAASAMGRSLMQELVSTAKPETILV